MISTKEYIDQVHERVKKMIKDKMTDEEIIAVLKSEGMTEYYAQTLIENVHQDKHDKKGFWQLIVVGILALGVAGFLLFDSFRTGRLFLWFFLAALGTGIVMTYRAITIFRK